MFLWQFSHISHFISHIILKFSTNIWKRKNSIIRIPFSFSSSLTGVWRCRGILANKTIWRWFIIFTNKLFFFIYVELFFLSIIIFLNTQIIMKFVDFFFQLQGWFPLAELVNYFLSQSTLKKKDLIVFGFLSVRTNNGFDVNGKSWT